MSGCNAIQARNQVLTGTITAEELTSAVIDRIETENPKVNALSYVLSEDALIQAKKLDAAIADGKELGPLAGVPVAIKENCDTTRAICSAGLDFRENRKPRIDSWITRSLRKAGAIIVGVSVSDPGAFDVRTKNVTHPIQPDLTVGGSSGGSAAALLAGMCLGAIGTDTGGSIRIPSACCGTVGLKPSFGALPMDGILPLVESLDHVGPMAKSVGEVELIWNAISPQSSRVRKAIKCIGYDPTHIDEAHPEVRAEVAKVLDFCSENGIACEEIELPNLDDVSSMHGLIFVVEAARFHLANYGEFRELYPKIARDWFDLAPEISIGQYIEEYTNRAHFTKHISALYNSIDCIVTPTIACPTPNKKAPTVNISNKERDFTMGMVRHTCLFDHTGHPALSMPLRKQKKGIAPSIQLISDIDNEAALLAFGRKIERVFRTDLTNFDLI